MCGFSLSLEGDTHHLLVTKKKELLWLGNVNGFHLLDDIKVRGRTTLTPDADKNNDWEIQAAAFENEQ